MTEYVAKVCITDNNGTVIADIGDTVPLPIVQKSRWLVEQGKVVKKDDKEPTDGI